VTHILCLMKFIRVEFQPFYLRTMCCIVNERNIEKERIWFYPGWVGCILTVAAANFGGCRCNMVTYSASDRVRAPAAYMLLTGELWKGFER